MLDAVTRPAKALVYGTALFRYTHSPFILILNLAQQHPPYSHSENSNPQNKQGKNGPPVTAQLSPYTTTSPFVAPLSQQTLLAMNNHNAYTYERTPRTTTIKTEREAE